MSHFKNLLSATQICEFDNIWQLDKPLVYQSDLLGEIVVPAGFKTDFASVPRLVGMYLLFGGKGERAAVVHDWLYSQHKVSRELADDVFREALIATGYARWEYEPMYAGVRVGGWVAWKKPNVPQDAAVAQIMEAGAGG